VLWGWIYGIVFMFEFLGLGIDVELKLRQFLFFVFVFILFGILGDLVADTLGKQIGYGMATILMLYVYFWGDKHIIRRYNATKITGTKKEKNLRVLLKNTSQKLKMTPPILYTIPDASPNAMVIGINKENAKILVTEGLMLFCDEIEQEAVIAQQLALIKRYYTVGSTISAVSLGIIFKFSTLFNEAIIRYKQAKIMNGIEQIFDLIQGIVIGFFVLPIAKLGTFLLMDRQKILSADLIAGRALGAPQNIQKALKKLEHYSSMGKPIQAVPEHSHLFMFNPFYGQDLLDSNYASIHPKPQIRRGKLQVLIKKLDDERRSKKR
jgi:heat shock protein HtpX